METSKRICIPMIFLLAMACTTLSAQSKKEKRKQREQAVKELVVSENYKIDVNTCLLYTSPSPRDA